MFSFFSLKKGKHSKSNFRKKENKIKKRRKKRNCRGKKEKRTLTLLILFILIIISLFIITNKLYINFKTKKDYEEIKVVFYEENQQLKNRTEKIKELKNINSDIVGWLEIANTSISYPVLQGKDNSYYMTHNYKKEKSKEGSLFLDKYYDLEKYNSNLLIYGHNNLGSTEMFNQLIEYKDENFLKTHKNIRYTTDTQDYEYEIISVFLSKVYNKDEKNVFRYYYYIDLNDEEKFNEYIINIKKDSLYEIEATAEYGDELITLSTCEYSVKDGRFVVVAKKIK